MTSEITDTQIKKLRTESGEAGDLEQCAICTRALGEDRGLDDEEGIILFRDQWEVLRSLTMSADEARAECARVIGEARSDYSTGEVRSITDYDIVIQVRSPQPGQYEYIPDAEPEDAADVARDLSSADDAGELTGWGDWERVFRALDEDGEARWYFARTEAQ